MNCKLLEPLKSISGLDDKKAAELVSLAATVRYRKGQVLYREHDRHTSVHIVLEGVVRLSRCINGRDIVLCLLGPGKLFGEMDAPYPHPATVTAETVEPSILLNITQEHFREFLFNRP